MVVVMLCLEVWHAQALYQWWVFYLEVRQAQAWVQPGLWNIINIYSKCILKQVCKHSYRRVVPAIFCCSCQESFCFSHQGFCCSCQDFVVPTTGFLFLPSFCCSHQNFDVSSESFYCSCQGFSFQLLASASFIDKPCLRPEFTCI